MVINVKPRKVNVVVSNLAGSRMDCPLCGEKVPKDGPGFKQHLTVVHGADTWDSPADQEEGSGKADVPGMAVYKQPKYVCPICSTGYKTLAGVKKHLAVAHGADIS
jgi:hypothetical protein